MGRSAARDPDLAVVRLNSSRVRVAALRAELGLRVAIDSKHVTTRALLGLAKWSCVDLNTYV